MIIAFITTNSGLVPLIEGLCEQILYFRCEIISGLRSHLLLFFVGRENMFKKKAVSPRSFCLLAYTYTCVLCTHIRIHICRNLVHLDYSGPPGVSSRPLGSRPSTPRVVCVRVCVYRLAYTRIHLHILPTLSKNGEITDKNSYLVMSKITSHTSNKCLA